MFLHAKFTNKYPMLARILLANSDWEKANLPEEENFSQDFVEFFERLKQLEELLHTDNPSRFHELFTSLIQEDSPDITHWLGVFVKLSLMTRDIDMRFIIPHSDKLELDLADCFEMAVYCSKVDSARALYEAMKEKALPPYILHSAVKRPALYYKEKDSGEINCYPIINLLLNAGADLEARDQDGRTPLSYCFYLIRTDETHLYHSREIYHRFVGTNSGLAIRLIKAGADLRSAIRGFVDYAVRDNRTKLNEPGNFYSLLRVPIKNWNEFEAFLWKKGLDATALCPPYYLHELGEQAIQTYREAGYICPEFESGRGDKIAKELGFESWKDLRSAFLASEDTSMYMHEIRIELKVKYNTPIENLLERYTDMLLDRMLKDKKLLQAYHDQNSKLKNRAPTPHQGTQQQMETADNVSSDGIPAPEVIDEQHISPVPSSNQEVDQIGTEQPQPYSSTPPLAAARDKDTSTQPATGATSGQNHAGEGSEQASNNNGAIIGGFSGAAVGITGVGVEAALEHTGKTSLYNYAMNLASQNQGVVIASFTVASVALVGILAWIGTEIGHGMSR